MDPSAIESGALAILAVLLYALIDKVIVPLIGKKNDRPARRTEDYIADDHGRRLDRLETDLAEVRAGLSDIRASSQVVQAILERLERHLRE